MPGREPQEEGSETVPPADGRFPSRSAPRSAATEPGPLSRPDLQAEESLGAFVPGYFARREMGRGRWILMSTELT